MWFYLQRDLGPGVFLSFGRKVGLRSAEGRDAFRVKAILPSRNVDSSLYFFHIGRVDFWSCQRLKAS